MSTALELSELTESELMVRWRKVLGLDLNQIDNLTLLSNVREQLRVAISLPELAEPYGEQHLQDYLPKEAEGLNLDEKIRLLQIRLNYQSLPNEIQQRSLWETIETRLLINNGEKLKLSMSMQGGGELFGIDERGKALFKDKGTEPVMYGFDKEDKPLKIYGREPEQMKQVEKWSNYFEIREQVLNSGYELFPYVGDYEFSEEMQQVADQTGEPFVVSKDRKEWRVSWLESGDQPDYAGLVAFSPDVDHVYVDDHHPGYRSVNRGACRLLRV